MSTVYKKLFEMKQYLGSAVKSKENKFTNSKYIDINGILRLTEPVLQEIGLVVVDEIRENVLVTKVIDPETGDFIESVASLIMVKQDPQAYMSSLSYMRRANRVALLGITQEDDDGSMAAGQKFATPAQIKKITALITETGADTQKLLKAYGVPMVKDMLEETANAAIKALELKKSKMEGK